MSLEGTATDVVNTIRSLFIEKQTGQSALPLVRLYVTERYSEMEAASQDFARAAGPDAPARASITCLTLVASAGEEDAWNDRHASAGHKAIPLPSVEALRRSPMVARLVEQLGLDPEHVVDPDPALFRELSDRALNLFFVAEARDSPYVPAQANFVIPYGIRSVLGFGGVMPDGRLFAVVIFSATAIPPSAVDGFEAIALSVKFALLAYTGRAVFAGQRAPLPAVDPSELETLVREGQLKTLTQLLDVRANLQEDEGLRLEGDLIAIEEQSAALAVSRTAVAASEARKSSIIEGALDCIIGMDSSGRITDFNRAAESAFGYSRHEVIGEVLSELIIPYRMRERHRTGLVHLLATGEGPVLGRRIEVNALRRDGSEFPVELTVVPVADTDPPLFNGCVRDITARQQAEAELEAGRQRLAHIARTLQSSLLPPTLPEIDGFELAAAFQAFGEGYEVGGDFYDAFELAAGHWALSLGDVCGKGSDAAAITALARYTLRAAAMRSSDPSAVLETLNEAIHRQYPDQFCTGVYATLDPGTGVLQLAVGGHPRPFLLSAAGDVTQEGTTSMLLGSFPEWRGTTSTIELAPGDMLFLYSDGATEARRGATLFGEERLATAVSDSAGLSAASAVELIQRRIVDFAGELSDDLAILAVRYRTPYA